VAQLASGVLLPVLGWTGPCKEPPDPSDEGERLWERVWRRVPLPGNVNLEVICHSRDRSLTTGTRPRQTLSQEQSGA